ncbi:MAG TPA: hypothetical protein PL012_17845 [Candidatus Obscuribacter sp.]|nr:hypothetical protein [Candidatus Obscuribacter sp.]
MKTLIVQDFRAIGSLEAKTLSQSGHQVTWVTGFKDVQALVAISPTGDAVSLDTDYDLAIVDGELDGPSGHTEPLGEAVVARLNQAGVACIANSSQDEYNKRMLNAGARCAINQLVLFACLAVAHMVQAEDLLCPDDTKAALLNQGLLQFISESPGKEWRQATEAALSAL